MAFLLQSRVTSALLILLGQRRGETGSQIRRAGDLLECGSDFLGQVQEAATSGVGWRSSVTAYCSGLELFIPLWEPGRSGTKQLTPQLQQLGPGRLRGAYLLGATKTAGSDPGLGFQTVSFPPFTAKCIPVHLSELFSDFSSSRKPRTQCFWAKPGPRSSLLAPLCYLCLRGL